MTIHWTSELAVGIEEIDREHQELFRHTKVFFEALQVSSGAAAVVPLLQFLADYVHRHFEAEERLMRLCRYPGLVDHQAEHASASQEVMRLVADQRMPSTATITMRLTECLSRLLRAHVVRSDLALRDYLDTTGSDGAGKDKDAHGLDS